PDFYLRQRADNLLCFNQDGNASLSPLSEKARSLLAQATVEAMRNELELKSAAVKDIQTDLYDSSEGRIALPGAFGYGMTNPGSTAIIASDMFDVARTAHNVHPGRYYTFSTQTEETTGITEIIWLDNGWGDKTSQTATKLVLFFGKDGRILMTVRGDNISAPVTWTNLTPQLGNAAQKDAQENIYDRTEGRLAIPGMFGFGKVFSSGDRTEFKTEADFLRWVKTAKPGRYAVYADTNAVIQGVLFKGTVEIIWPESQPNPNPAYVAKIIIFYGINGHIYYNRYWTSGDGYLVGWENVKFSLTAKDVALWLPYTATPDDTAKTGQQIWQELQSGKWGEIAPFTVTPEMLEAAKDAKKREIEVWRTEQEAQPFTFEWNGRTWNAGPDSLARLYPVVMAAKSDTARTTLAWGDADNQQVKLSMPELEELAAAMAQAQVDRNDEIYRRQREMKQELNSLEDLHSIRKLVVSSEKP
ncbi:DUF4376 domain-containing protein, partial [Escherichia coli]